MSACGRFEGFVLARAKLKGRNTALLCEVTFGDLSAHRQSGIPVGAKETQSRPVRLFDCTSHEKYERTRHLNRVFQLQTVLSALSPCGFNSFLPRGTSI